MLSLRNTKFNDIWKKSFSNDASKKTCACQTLVIGHLLIFGILRQDFCNFYTKNSWQIAKRHLQTTPLTTYQNTIKVCATNDLSYKRKYRNAC